jgi:cytidylate kinase
MKLKCAELEAVIPDAAVLAFRLTASVNERAPRRKKECKR